MEHPVFKFMKYLASVDEVRAVYNDHFGYNLGDTNYWADLASSPIWPVSEQPESDDFYILYNSADDLPYGSWWHLNTTVGVSVYSNNVMLIETMVATLRKELSDYEFAAARINKWAFEEGLDGPLFNYVGYMGAEPLVPTRQENGVMSRFIEFEVNSMVC